MKAVIMCGGTGSRLRPLTEATPKPLVKLMNIPILEQILNRVISAGIDDIYLSLGYKAQDIISYCERRSFNAHLHYCEEERPLGTAGGVKNCISQSGEPIVVLSGDNIFNIDLSKAAAFHCASGALVTILGKEVEDPREYGVILKDAEGNITSFQEKPTWETAASFLINTGIYILDGPVLDRIPPHRYYDFAEHLFPELLREKKKLMCYHTVDFWGDIGEFPAYLELTEEILKEHAEEFMLSGTLFTEDHTDDNGNTILAPSLIGKNCDFGKNNRIGPFCVIGDGVTVGEDCDISGSILGENVRIESRSDVTHAVLDDFVKIGTDCVIEKHAVLGYGAEIGRFSRVLSEMKVWPGRKVSPESVVSNDMFFETPDRIEPDVFGVSGRAFSQFSLNDAVKLGQALASVKTMRRIGIGGDGTGISEIYKSVCAGGIRSCGVICYDFEEIFRAQSYFYGAYCNLDAFLYISSADQTVSFSFFGKNGMPFDPKTARTINNNFRFSSFHFDFDEKNAGFFRMNLLSTAYTAALHKILGGNLHGRKIRFECENTALSALFGEFLAKAGAADEPGGIQFLINETGTDMYCIENDRFYGSDRLKAVLCELRLAEGKPVVIGEDAPDFIPEKAKQYNCAAVRLLENSDNETVSEYTFLENLWNFDAVFLCVKLLSVLVQANMSVAELMTLQSDFAIRKRVIELNCPPSKIRRIIEDTGAVKQRKRDAYYTVQTEKGTAKIRQLGNANRIRILVQAADLEAAKELGGDICAKFRHVDIDNNIKK